MNNKEQTIAEYIGNKARERRKFLKISQQKVANLLGVSFQQIQKYENGKNRIPSTRIISLCQILNVQSTYFYGENSYSSQEQELIENYHKLKKTDKSKLKNILNLLLK